MADQTLQSLSLFNDPSRWVVVRDIPIFREHLATLPDGSPFPITTEELGRFATELQRLEQTEGVLARLTLGHTLSKNKETGAEPREVDQPPVVGYARNAHVGLYGPAQNPAIMSDFWYRREDWDRAKEYPYRSPEVYLNSRQITGIALLKRDPKLDMGMTIYHGEKPDDGFALDQPKAYYQREDGVQFYAMDDESTSYRTREDRSDYVSLGSALAIGGTGYDMGQGRSFKNAAGRNAGALAGSGIGETIGSAYGPLGTVAGSVLGGMAGQFLGDEVTKDACGTMPTKMEEDEEDPEREDYGQECGNSCDPDAILQECLRSLNNQTAYSRGTHMGDEMQEYALGDIARGAGKVVGGAVRGVKAAGGGIARAARAVGGAASTAGGAVKSAATRASGAVNAGLGKVGPAGLSAARHAGSAVGSTGRFLGRHPVGAGLAGAGLAAGAGYLAGRGRQTKNADPEAPVGTEEAAPEAGGGGEEEEALAGIADQFGQMAPEEFAQLLQHLTELYKQSQGMGGEGGGEEMAAEAPPEAAPAPEEVPQAMHRSQMMMAQYERNAQLQNQAINQLQQKLGQLEREKIVNQFHSELRDLDALGWTITDRDFDRVARMSREAFEEYKQVLQEHGARHHGSDDLIPVGEDGMDAVALPSEKERAVLYARRSNEREMQAETNRLDKVTDYMREKECTWEEANAAFDRNGRLIKRVG